MFIIYDFDVRKNGVIEFYQGKKLFELWLELNLCVRPN